jgi:hypothetical protein
MGSATGGDTNMVFTVSVGYYTTQTTNEIQTSDENIRFSVTNSTTADNNTTGSNT